MMINSVQKIGDATLYLGNCLKILPILSKVDSVITDPPYDAKTHKGARYGFWATNNEIDFLPINPADIVPPMLEISGGWVLAFCSLEAFGDYKTSAGNAWVRAGFWRRTNSVPQFTGDRPGQPGEGIAIMHSGNRKKQWNGHGSHAFWQYPIVSGGPHPTTKPTDLMKRLVWLFTNDSDTVLDPFMGSGTTGIACAKLKRKFIGIEIEEKYFDIACERIQEAYNQPNLFELKKPKPKLIKLI